MLRLLSLRDGRILACIEIPEGEDNSSKYIKKDINVPSITFFEMSDGNVLINYRVDHNEIIKIKKDSIELIYSIIDYLSK